MLILLLQPILVGKHNHNAGDTIEVQDDRAKDLIEKGKAVLPPKLKQARKRHKNMKGGKPNV